MSDTNPRQTFSHFAKELNEIGLGYIHMVEPVGGRMGAIASTAKLAPIIQDIFEGTLILNGGYDFRIGNESIEKGDADLISFGVLFLANPDLPERFRKNAPLNQADVATFYNGEEKGYIDYPKLG
jgi:N-ethylmaleimide reductase